MPGFPGVPSPLPAASSGSVAPWVTETELIEDHPGTAYADGAATKAIAIASEVLYHLTGRRWPGIQSDIIRPLCSCSATADPCAWTRWGGIHLPGFPVLAVTAVQIGGVVLDPASYVVADRRSLVRLDGQVWPCSPLASQVLGGSPPVEVAYQWGRQPTTGGRAAASALAHQMALALSPDLCGSCALPRRVTTITRQGVSMIVLDPMTMISDGFTGLAEVDLWISSLRIGDRQTGGAVIVPGVHRRAVRVPGP